MIAADKSRDVSSLFSAFLTVRQRILLRNVYVRRLYSFSLYAYPDRGGLSGNLISREDCIMVVDGCRGGKVSNRILIYCKPHPPAPSPPGEGEWA